MQNFKIISITDTVGKTLIHKELLDTLKGSFNVQVLYLLAYNNKELVQKLEKDSCDYIIFENEIKFVRTFLKYFKIPFIRVLLVEIIYYFQSKKIIKRVFYNKIDFIITNYGMKNIVKYLSAYYKKHNDTIITTYIYGVGLRDSNYSKLNKKKVFAIYPQKNLFYDTIRLIEQFIFVYILDLLKLVRFKDYSLFNFGCDYILVKGEGDKKEFIKHGFPEKMVHVIGSLWDLRINKLKNEKSDLLIDQKKVIIITQPFYLGGSTTNSTHFRNLDRLLKSLLNSSNNNLIIVKLHPRENIEDYEFLKRKYHRINFLSHLEANTQLLVSEAEIVISQNSTVILDVIKLNKYLLFYKFEENIEYPFHPFPKLFNNFCEYNLDLTLAENIEVAKTMKVNMEEYKNWEQSGNIEEGLKNFFLSINKIS